LVTFAPLVLHNGHPYNTWTASTVLEKKQLHRKSGSMIVYPS
jgi:hypothetical protein